MNACHASPVCDCLPPAQVEFASLDLASEITLHCACSKGVQVTLRKTATYARPALLNVSLALPSLTLAPSSSSSSAAVAAHAIRWRLVALTATTGVAAVSAVSAVSAVERLRATSGPQTRRRAVCGNHRAEGGTRLAARHGTTRLAVLDDRVASCGRGRRALR